MSLLFVLQEDILGLDIVVLVSVKDL